MQKIIFHINTPPHPPFNVHKKAQPESGQADCGINTNEIYQEDFLLKVMV